MTITWQVKKYMELKFKGFVMCESMRCCKKGPGFKILYRKKTLAYQGDRLMRIPAYCLLDFIPLRQAL